MNEKKTAKRGTYKTEKRNISIRVRLSENEKILFDERLKKANLSQAEFIRQAILKSKIKAAPIKKGVDLGDVGDIYVALSRIGNNLNQIARHYNYGEPRTREIDYELRKNLTELVKLQAQIALKVGEKNGDFKT